MGEGFDGVAYGQRNFGIRVHRSNNNHNCGNRRGLQLYEGQGRIGEEWGLDCYHCGDYDAGHYALDCGNLNPHRRDSLLHLGIGNIQPVARAKPFMHYFGYEVTDLCDLS